MSAILSSLGSWIAIAGGITVAVMMWHGESVSLALWLYMVAYLLKSFAYGSASNHKNLWRRFPAKPESIPLSWGERADRITTPQTLLYADPKANNKP